MCKGICCARFDGSCTKPSKHYILDVCGNPIHYCEACWRPDT